MSQQLDTLARLGLAGAIVNTFETGCQTSSNVAITPEINRLLVALQSETEKALSLYHNVNLMELMRVDRKIEAIKKQTSIGKPLSIVTFIEFALCILDDPCRKCKGISVGMKRKPLEPTLSRHGSPLSVNLTLKLNTKK